MWMVSVNPVGTQKAATLEIKGYGAQSQRGRLLSRLAEREGEALEMRLQWRQGASRCQDHSALGSLCRQAEPWLQQGKGPPWLSAPWSLWKCFLEAERM